MALIVAIILFCTGILCGVVAFSIMAAYASWKAAKRVQEENRRNNGQAYI